MKAREGLPATAVFVDIRNFTTNLKKYYRCEDYFILVENVYKEGMLLAQEISGSDNFYLNSTGDGFLIIFFNTKHYLEAFYFSLLLQHNLKAHFISFFKDDLALGDYYYGIGLESGYVKKVYAEVNGQNVTTFLGNVINISARLEALSKEHSRAPIIYGPEINEKLVGEISKDNYSELMEKAIEAKTSERSKDFHRKMSDYNSELLSSYLFEHKLKGVDKSVPTFRISPSLFNFKKNHFWDLITKIKGAETDRFIMALDKRNIKNPINQEDT